MYPQVIQEERLECQWFKHSGRCAEAQRVSTAFLRLVLEEVRKEANPVGEELSLSLLQ